MNSFDIHAVLDYIEEGLIVLDAKGTILSFNKKAKEITGMILNAYTSHPEGKLEPGDLVVLADNRLGYDDGHLSPEDFSLLSVDAKALSLGDAVIAAGIYRHPKTDGFLEFQKNTQFQESMSLSAQIEGMNVFSQIDFQNKRILISIDHDSYPLNYALAVGHMVVINPKTRALKFYQAKGYTVRQEDAATLLKGGTFSAKGINPAKFCVIGKKIGDFVEYDKLLVHIYGVLENQKPPFQDAYFEINKRPTICSLFPLMEGTKASGAVLKIVDVSELERLFLERNELLSKMSKSNAFINNFSQEGAKHSFKYLIGESSVMNQVKYLIYKASLIKATVLLTGESGTGKSLAAKEIHHLSLHAGAPFIVVNCSAIPLHLFESELFGYEKGAFTGAEKTGKKGFFELADGGILFLDEIGDLPLDIQAKLLHVLQNKSFYKVGAAKPTTVNVRIITATNRRLEEEVAAKRFREDLYYRINVFPIEMPPLRARKKDIYLLVSSLLEKLSSDYDMPAKALSAEAMQKILSFEWPGNVRELENVLERGFNLSDSKTIEANHLAIKESFAPPSDLKSHLAQAEKEWMEAALQRFNYNAKKTMAALGLSKSVFYEKIHKYGLKK